MDSGILTKRTCPRCGAKFPGNALGGLCPACVGRLTMEPDPGFTAASSSSVVSGSKPRLRFFGDYELQEEIARGGMGVVYKARQLSLDRTVAVKMILGGQLAGVSDVQRFRAEAEAAASLRHPNIVAIHEVGEHDGQHFFSMDYVEGRSLAEIGACRRSSDAKWFGQAATWIKILAEAIYYAHQQDTLHRDIKPSNILIDGN